MTKLLKLSALFISAILLLASCNKVSDIDGDSDAPIESECAVASDNSEYTGLKSIFNHFTVQGGTPYSLHLGLIDAADYTDGEYYAKTIYFDSTGTFSYLDRNGGFYDAHGSWRVDGNTLCLTEKLLTGNDEAVACFTIEDGCITFSKEKSKGPYTMRFADGDKYIMRTTDNPLSLLSTPYREYRVCTDEKVSDTCYIAFCEDGTGIHSMPIYSSYLGTFTWTRDGDNINIKDDVGGKEYHFTTGNDFFADSSITFVAACSNQFDAFSLKDGDKLTHSTTYTEADSVVEAKPLNMTFFSRQNNDGFNSFGITFNTDGTFSYSESALSSYIGLGIWTMVDDIVCMREVRMGKPCTYYFRYSDGKLAYIAEGSDNFGMVPLNDGDEFDGGEMPEQIPHTTYYLEGKGDEDFPSFFISLFENGRFICLDGGHVRKGLWEIDGDKYHFAYFNYYTGADEFYFSMDGDRLVYIAEESSDFTFEKLSDGMILCPEK